jgi:TonB-dependent starch-binding outer membrane protein SusC
MKLFLSCLFAFAITFSSFAQTTLRGTVKDASGNLVDNVTLRVEGKEVFATFNTAGSFTIELIDGYETLLVYAKGFKSQTIYLAGQTQLDVVLVKEPNQDVVNLGIGSQSKDQMSGSVSSIQSDEMIQAPLTNLEQANQGVTSGLQVQNSGGNLGAPAVVRIRGGSSLSQSNAPLYVVDGVPLTSGSQSSLNPNNIASMEVLKDASATAIYGTRAANGVIIITTKSGRDSGLQVNLDYQFGISETVSRLDLINAKEHRIMMFENEIRSQIDFIKLGASGEVIVSANGVEQVLNRTFFETYFNNPDVISFEDSGGTVQNIQTSRSAFLDSLVYDTDWQDQIFRTAASHKFNVDFSGGTDKMGYFASVGYNTQEGILIGNKFDRFNGTVSFDAELTSKLDVGLNFNYSNTKTDDLQENQDVAFPLQAILLPPTDSFDPTDNYNLYVFGGRNFYNPMTEINFADFISKSNSYISSLNLNYSLMDNLDLNVNGGYERADFRTDLRQGPETLEGQPSGNSRISEQLFENYILDARVSYTQDIGGNNLGVILGSSYQKTVSTFDERQAFINSISQLETLETGNALLNSNPITGAANALVSSYLRLNYDIKNLYFFQLSTRMDASSKFDVGNRVGFFPSLSAGWNIVNESFFGQSSAINQLKLRASYGLVGNTPFGDFLYRNNYGIIKYDNRDAIELTNLGNSDLKWETTAQLNVGLDFSILNQKISGSFDYYNKSTTDLLFPFPVSQTTGFSSITDNIGSMTNKGFEVMINTVNVSNADFAWTSSLNISANKNNISDLGGQQSIIGVNAYLENQPAGIFYMRRYVGVDPATGLALYDDGNDGTTTDWEAAPRQIVGNPNPEFFGGLTNTLSYKSFDFSFLFQFVQGVDLYFATGEFLANSGYNLQGQLSSQIDRWYAPGDVAPNPGYDIKQTAPQPSSRWLQDGSYVRLKNVTFSYNFPESVLNKLNLRNMSIYVGGANLFTITDYEGFDPDVSYSDPNDGVIGQNISRGIDNFSTPQSRIIMSGIKIGI